MKENSVHVLNSGTSRNIVTRKYSLISVLGSPELKMMSLRGEVANLRLITNRKEGGVNQA